MKIYNRGVQVGYDLKTIGSTTYKVREFDQEGNILRAFGTTVPSNGVAGFAKGARFIDTDVASGLEGTYVNVGTTSSCVFVSEKEATAVSVTATADGTGTGAIPAYADFVTVTSSGATQQVALPAAAVGKVIRIWVGSNGFELITPAASNATINNVDSDGTNQADIAANTLSTLVCVSSTGWILMNQSNLGAVNTAIIPDND